MNITVYSKPNCQQCTATKRWLTQHGVEFTEDDITTEDNLAAAKALGYQEAPVVIVSSEGVGSESHWSGFRPDKLNLLLV